MCKCNNCLYNKNCQFLLKHKDENVDGCTAFYGWIDVNEELPEKEGEYLVHYHDDVIGEYVITRQYWEKARKFAPMEYFEEHTGRKAMHWMPLPEPPKNCQ